MWSRTFEEVDGSGPDRKRGLADACRRPANNARVDVAPQSLTRQTEDMSNPFSCARTALHVA